MKKTFLVIFCLFFLINLTGCKNEGEKVNSISLEKRIEACDRQQGIINMIIIPSCYLRGMLTYHQYTKQEALDYCLEHWHDCEKGMLTAWGSLGGDYNSLCREKVFNNKDYSEIGEYLKPCILDKLITNNKLTSEEAVEYCKKEVPWGKGTCEEKIKEIEDYKKKYFK